MFVVFLSFVFFAQGSRFFYSLRMSRMIWIAGSFSWLVWLGIRSRLFFELRQPPGRIPMLIPVIMEIEKSSAVYNSVFFFSFLKGYIKGVRICDQTTWAHLPWWWWTSTRRQDRKSRPSGSVTRSKMPHKGVRISLKAAAMLWRKVANGVINVLCKAASSGLSSPSEVTESSPTKRGRKRATVKNLKERALHQSLSLLSTYLGEGILFVSYINCDRHMFSSFLETMDSFECRECRDGGKRVVQP